jgi:hypothetical protein
LATPSFHILSLNFLVHLRTRFSAKRESFFRVSNAFFGIENGLFDPTMHFETKHYEIEAIGIQYIFVRDSSCAEHVA